ncbi:hypothetical protein Sgly_0683 [Syntrophobotulus glycolicus DSM 8271]|uniref:Uncharacterized protein n=1 Tax=Syntrophobotulus glycolicus (strain DSM 8271 / FlGlyR) TaxID=645991 RepID=F0T0I0_SYNGF|nr:hypothetical protein [Syntrophobotulus glycolicus]ADY55045.1 hypothetical protein Sgly_0683 [Syntrophobotulus glycolicus DSM 8271]
MNTEKDQINDDREKDLACSACGSQIVCEASLNMPKLAGKLYMEDFVHSIKVICKGCGKVYYAKEYKSSEDFQWEEIIEALKGC